MRRGKDEFSGSLKVGVAPTVTLGLLPSLLPQFIQTYPNVDIRLTEAFSGKLTEWTLAGEVDLSVVAVAPNDRRLIARRIAVEPIVLVSGARSGRKHLEVGAIARGKRDQAYPAVGASQHSSDDRSLHAIG